MLGQEKEIKQRVFIYFTCITHKEYVGKVRSLFDIEEGSSASEATRKFVKESIDDFTTSGNCNLVIRRLLEEDRQDGVIQGILAGMLERGSMLRYQTPLVKEGTPDIDLGTLITNFRMPQRSDSAHTKTPDCPGV